MEQENLIKELSRCLGCKASPCAKACPLGVSPHDFIALAKNNDYPNAAAAIAAKNPLPQTCGLVCPDMFCQKACIRARIDTPIEIPCLQAYVMQQGSYPKMTFPPLSGKKAAVVGGGPAGLGATFELLNNGWEIDLFEKSDVLGGAARLIPPYRLPKEVLDFEIARLTENNRVKVHLSTEITDFQKLKEEYDGVILALGETTPRTLGINGEHHSISYTEFLRHPEKYRHTKIAISGGGEVALDCALTAKKNGCECVEMFVRRRRTDMRIMPKDQLELERFGVVVRELSSVTEIKKENQCFSLMTVKNRINDEGRAEPCAEPASDLSGYDIFVQALGAYYPKEQIPEGFIIAGDMTGTAGMVVSAIASGKKAAEKLINGEDE